VQREKLRSCVLAATVPRVSPPAAITGSPPVALATLTLGVTRRPIAGRPESISLAGDGAPQHFAVWVSDASPCPSSPFVAWFGDTSRFITPANLAGLLFPVREVAFRSEIEWRPSTPGIARVCAWSLSGSGLPVVAAAELVVDVQAARITLADVQVTLRGAGVVAVTARGVAEGSGSLAAYLVRAPSCPRPVDPNDSGVVEARQGVDVEDGAYEVELELTAVQNGPARVCVYSAAFPAQQETLNASDPVERSIDVTSVP